MEKLLKLKEKQILKQNLSLNQYMKLSINILGMSIEDLKDYLKEEIENNIPIEVNFSSRPKNYEQDDVFNDEIENLTQEKNFFEELEEQINLLKIDRKQKEICIFIINNLNKKGYLEISKNEISKILKIDQRTLEKAFEVIYSLEPYGLAAYSLEECLILQLKQKNIFDEKLYELVNKYLVLIAESKFELIMSKLKIDRETLNEYIKEIKKLNPIPTRGYNTEEIRKIIPELVLKLDNGEYYCELNEKVIPKISLRTEENLDKNIYIKTNDLIKAVEKRYKTILDIGNFLVKKQKSFFQSRGEKIETLKIIDVAENLSLSASTISRALKDKYIRTAFGTVALKSLICLNSDKNLEKQLIEKYITEENREKPYSDEELRKFLLKDGFKIARRTITKYREELGYKSSSKRKV